MNDLLLALPTEATSAGQWKTWRAGADITAEERKMLASAHAAYRVAERAHVAAGPRLVPREPLVIESLDEFLRGLIR